ncbi:MAG: membrane protein [marine bacterium B5-7]|nr:MAG: membrane protein [marine bacterium B5-7]
MMKEIMLSFTAQYLYNWILERDMQPELFYLLLVIVFTAVLWIPYILDRVAVCGFMDAVGYPENPKPQSAWARRLMKAHANAIENLVIFASLVLLADAMDVSGPTIAFAAMLYFWSRVVHAVSYTFAIPWVRTLSFAVCFVAQVIVAWQLLVSV